MPSFSSKKKQNDPTRSERGTVFQRNQVFVEFMKFQGQIFTIWFCYRVALYA